MFRKFSVQQLFERVLSILTEPVSKESYNKYRICIVKEKSKLFFKSFVSLVTSSRRIWYNINLILAKFWKVQPKNIISKSWRRNITRGYTFGGKFFSWTHSWNHQRRSQQFSRLFCKDNRWENIVHRVRRKLKYFIIFHQYHYTF